MFFHEIYSAYYNVIAQVLKEAVSTPVTEDRLKEIITQQAFGESIVSIPDAIREGRWQLLKPDGSTCLRYEPTLPLTLMQKRWLKAVYLDPRIRLFGEFDFGLSEIEPLFLPSDVIIFDRYSDGDNFEDATYVANFRLILDAIRNKYLIDGTSRTRKDRILQWTLMPERLEYSEKDDKFRLIGTGGQSGYTVNLGRIISCRPSEKKIVNQTYPETPEKQKTVVFELNDERKTLERALLHFAHFEKSAERLDERKYIVTVHYEREDETEVLIRILSFGPMIKVTAPEDFIHQIRQRLLDQKSCEQ